MGWRCVVSRSHSLPARSPALQPPQQRSPPKDPVGGKVHSAWALTQMPAESR
ncbi:MAG TPA: hypothetical protein VHP37_06245 [Burkholderiales bacterium]|nr:hypothetical protein [Burkholderiales bacterium]